MTKVYLYWFFCIQSMNYWNICAIKCTSNEARDSRHWETSYDKTAELEWPNTTI